MTSKTPLLVPALMCSMVPMLAVAPIACATDPDETYIDPFEGGLYKDDDNYVKWSMEHSWRDPGTNNLILVRESDSQPDHALIESKAAPDDFWLKIARSGDQYVCSFSEDGDDYELIGFKEWEEDAGPGVSRIGFLSKNGGDPDAEEIDAVIDSFELHVYGAK